MASLIIRFKTSPGATFTARLIDTSGQQVGNDITDDFVEISPGRYEWQANGEISSTFEGEIRIVNSTTGVVVRRVAISGNMVGYPPPNHNHEAGEVNGLTATLAAKVDNSDSRLSDARTPTAHNHAQGDVSGLDTALAGKSDTNHTHQGGSLTLADVYPVGSIYTSVVATNPATVFGFGTWAAFGAGRVLVGVDTNQTEFDTVEKTGGEKTHTLTESEIPSHTHTQDAHTHGVTDAGHTHLTQRYPTATGGSSGFTVDTSMSGTLADNNLPTKAATTGVSIDSATATNQATGGGAAHNNLPPYLTVYFFQRTA